MAEDAPIPHELEQAAAQAGPKSSHRSTAEAGSAAGQQEAPAEHVMVTLKFLIPLFLDLNFTHVCCSFEAAMQQLQSLTVAVTEGSA